jgi:hypothetical protein
LRISHTISCFCLGVTLQQITDLHKFTNLNNLSYSVTFSKSSPVTTRQQSLPSGYCSLSASTSSMCYFHFMRAISYEISPHDIPILMAVYFLSPVNIHTFTPASLNLYIVIFTLSCSLSSIAVLPISSNYFSITSYSYFVSLVTVVVVSISDRCFYKNFFCDSVSTELSFNNLFIMIVGSVYSLFLFP